ncbi:MAG: hypothetical protein P1P88_14995 [Bacteroidales bacterium]|nr:hypothetical protein [Bacteroidales bacterium]
MGRIQFKRSKKKKSYLIPLVIVLLLYFIIPVYLINKGSDLVKISLTKIENGTVYSPPVEFYNGISFLSTAAAFPGFGKWAENIIDGSVEKMSEQQDKQFNKLCVRFLKDVNDLQEGVEISFVKLQNPGILQFKNEKTDSMLYELSLNDSLLAILDSTYCKPWTKFYNKTKQELTKIHLYCKPVN